MASNYVFDVLDLQKALGDIDIEMKGSGTSTGSNSVSTYLSSESDFETEDGEQDLCKERNDTKIARNRKRRQRQRQRQREQKESAMAKVERSDTQALELEKHVNSSHIPISGKSNSSNQTDSNDLKQENNGSAFKSQVKQGLPAPPRSSSNITTEMSTGLLPGEETIILKHILRKYSGCCTVHQLLEDRIFPHGTDIIDWVLSHSYIFKILLSTNERRAVVKAYHKGMRLCMNDAALKCKNPKCKFIHLCRDFVVGDCVRNNCRHSHSLIDAHNAKILNMNGMDTLAADCQLCLISCSNLQVCADYNHRACSTEGLYRSFVCPKVHMCEEFVKKTCRFSEADCPLAHNLNSPETIYLLNMYKLDQIDQQKIVQSLLVGKEHLKIKPGDFTCRSANIQGPDAKTAEKVFQYILINYKGVCTIQMLKNADIFPPSTHVAKWISCRETQFKLIPCSRDPNKFLVKVFQQGLRLCFKYVVECKNLECQFLHLCKDFLTGSCTKKICKYSHSLRDAPNARLLEKKGLANFPPDQQMCIISCSLLHICGDYNRGSCSIDGFNLSCHRVHICESFVRKRCSDENCHLSHTLNAPETDILLKIYRMNKLDEQVILKLLIVDKSSLYIPPQNRVKRFIPNMKKDLQSPTNMENIGFQRQQNPIQQNKQGRDVDRSGEALPKNRNQQVSTVQPSKSLPCPKKTGTDVLEQSTQQVHIHQDKENWICEKFIRKKCSKGRNCEFHHFPLPYLWQRRHGTNWNNISNNFEKEKDFCDVKENFNLSFHFFDGQSEGEESEPVVHCINLRRLSTRGYLSDRTNQGLYLTVWHWYWMDNGNIWRLYDTLDDNPPYQDVIESTFLSFQRNCPNCDFLYFETDKFRYRIDFRNMVQENLVTGKKREVRRRPAYVSEEDVLLDRSFPKPSINYVRKALKDFKMCSWSWVPMDTKSMTDHQRVLISDSTEEYNKIVQAFYATMDNTRYPVVQIFRIQNVHLYRNYERKKREILQRAKELGTSVVEKQLFHGTQDEVTVRCIANQCFDPRMHGKNGTAYGLGAYFARDASYSNNYTDRSGEDTQYMFLARVLVGKHTLGKASYKRPPPVDTSRPDGQLYDSCVNSLTDPHIYVVFDREQCYPEILIEYKYTLPKEEYYYPPVQSVSSRAMTQNLVRNSTNVSSVSALSRTTPSVVPSQSTSTPRPTISMSQSPPPQPRTDSLQNTGSAYHRTSPSVVPSQSTSTPRPTASMSQSPPPQPPTYSPQNTTPIQSQYVPHFQNQSTGRTPTSNRKQDSECTII